MRTFPRSCPSLKGIGQSPLTPFLVSHQRPPYCLPLYFFNVATESECIKVFPTPCNKQIHGGPGKEEVGKGATFWSPV